MWSIEDEYLNFIKFLKIYQNYGHFLLYEVLLSIDYIIK